MSATVETPEELRTKLGTFEQQKGQVDILLQKDPINRQFLKLRNDLQHVMALTRDLLQVSEANEAERKNKEAAMAAAAEGAVASSENNGLPPPSSSYEEDGQNNLESDLKDLGDLGEEEEAFALGSRVEVLKRDKWYPAVIEAVLDEGQNFHIAFIGFTGAEAKANATLLTMRQLKSPKGGLTKSQAVVGTRCMGLWVEDGQWYECVIEEVTPHGYSVIFSDYDNDDELPLEYLKEVGEDESETTGGKDASGNGNAIKPLPKSALNEDGSFRVPDSLVAQPEDTEQEKEKKKRKIKLLKNRYRLLAKQKESEVKQSSWQAFTGGKGKKRVKGTLKGLRKVSIFKSPELGGKVGVVGSGQGTTAYDSKKRYKLNSGLPD